MSIDPLSIWPEGNPYQDLAAWGIAPDSSFEAILLARKSAMTAGPTGELSESLRALATSSRRLALDFFLYFELPSELAAPDAEGPTRDERS